MGPQAGWLADPTGRHEYRWWDGTTWTEVVADQGIEGVDPMTPAPGPAPAPSQPHQPLHHQQAASGPGSLVIGALAVTLVVLVVAAAVAIVNRSGGDDDPGGGTDGLAAGVSPRDALLTIDDMPSGWEVAEATGAPGEDKVCEPRLEAPEPPREAEASFDRFQPSGALGHSIIETTPDFAADYVEDARRQANSCGTFTDEWQVGGETWSFTGTSEVVNGPAFGDQTIWYTIHLEYQQPTPSTHDVVVCMDRHGGVISEIVLSTASPTSADDRAMVEDLIRTAAERLQGGATG